MLLQKSFFCLMGREIEYRKVVNIVNAGDAEDAAFRRLGQISLANV